MISLALSKLTIIIIISSLLNHQKHVFWALCQNKQTYLLDSALPLIVAVCVRVWLGEYLGKSLWLLVVGVQTFNMRVLKTFLFFFAIG